MKCPYCGSDVVLKEASIISKKFAKYNEHIWMCSNYPECNSYVGCYPNTTTPRGRLANPRLRTLKKEAHKQFDKKWREGDMTREEAYIWLANNLHISLKDCHIGMFDVQMCKKVISLCERQV